MKKFGVILFAFIAFANFSAHAQDSTKGSLSGTIVDTISHNLTHATITLISTTDSTRKINKVSDDKGHFLFSGVPLGLYNLHVSYLGYEVVNKFVGLTKAHPNLNVGDITLQQTINDAGTVIVTAVIPVTLKGDTTEYSADAFGIKPNAVAQDLLQKLPGVEVDQNGNISHNGEAVTRVFVDGKRFFGTNPQMATQNLPAEVIDKIQVFDGKSDQSELTGFDDGTTIKTINIVTKKDRRHGWFGKNSAGGGEELSTKDGLYAVNSRIFRLDGNARISFIGQLNNINQLMYGQQTSNPAGITKTASAGINFADSLGHKTDFSGSYSYSNSNNNTISNSYTQTLYSDTADNTNSVQAQNSHSKSIGNNVNLNFDTKFDSSNELRVRPTLAFSNSNNSNSANTTIFHQFENSADSISKTNANTSSKSNGYSGSVSLTYAHKFHKAGRSVILDMQLAGSNSTGSATNNTNIYTFSDNLDSAINQINNSSNNSKSISTTLSYTEPIAKYQMLKLEYNNSLSGSNSNVNTFNLDTLTGEYSEENYILTNNYNNHYNTNRGTLSYMYSDSVMELNIGNGVQFGDNRSNNLSKNYTIRQNYVNMYPSANFRYKFSSTQQLQINYQGRTAQPSMAQMQPVENNSNPLNITAGNPNLKQQFTNTLLFRYRNVDRATFKSFSAYISGTYTTNYITSDITRLSNGGDSTNYVNFGHTYNIFGYANWSLPLNIPKSILNLSTRLSNSRSPELVNDTANYTTSTSIQERIAWSTNMKKNWDVNISTTPAYYITKYSFGTSGSGSQNTNANYYSQSIIFDGTWYDKKGWELASTFNYTFYKGNAPGANQSVPLWNASVGKLFFKNQAGELKLSVYDLLNEYKGVSFTRSANIISQSQNNVLHRYVMLTFTYNLRQFGSKRGNGDGNRPWMRNPDNGGFDGGGRGGSGGGFGGGGFGGGRGGPGDDTVND